MRILVGLSYLILLLSANGCRSVQCSLDTGKQRELLRRGLRDIRADIQADVRHGYIDGPVRFDADCCSLISRSTTPNVKDVTKLDNDVGYIVQVMWLSPVTGLPTLKQIEYDDCGREWRRTGV